ncbi:hypothetical protein [Streptomyces javensis]|uniref:Uncharacterized protein n=1 Tax=Streptomyces javensis TaxID=114698 RepID=A0ABS0R6X4_9ACTN|nr:hypothetical protein [Streptomyces javensis]MBI0313048.1 hypothetical protein [Streptomyces javensis]
MLDRDVTNADRAALGRAALEYYEAARAMVGHDPDEPVDAELALAACAHGASGDRRDPVRAEDLREDAEWTAEVIRDIVADLFHTADGAATPQLLLRAATALEDADDAAQAEAWRRAGPGGRRFALFLTAVRHALVRLAEMSGPDADSLLDDARAVFAEEVEEERFAAATARLRSA